MDQNPRTEDLRRRDDRLDGGIWPPASSDRQLVVGPSFPDLHSLEQMKVLRPRTLRSLFSRCKEWWYTGAYDADSGIYVSWYFIRVNLLEKLIMTVFDPKLTDGPLPRLSQVCRLDLGASGPGLCLQGRGGGGLEASYELKDGNSWEFHLRSASLSASIQIKQEVPGFTKFDNEMENQYAILHYFHSRASGVIKTTGGHEYRLKNALTYQDHCWGRVPSRTGWHWIAVQSEHVAVTVLVNYGVDAQRFAQAWLTPGLNSPRPQEWIRFSQEVSFECEESNDDKQPWRITSIDMDLDVTPKKWLREKTLIPPLHHTELFVEVSGRLRVDGKWIDTGRMYGVMEKHRGFW